PRCEAKLRLPPDAGGRAIRCSKCDHIFNVVTAADASSSSSTAMTTKRPPRSTAISEPKAPAAVKIPEYVRALAMLPFGIIIIGAISNVFGGGLIGGLIGGLFGGLLIGACLAIAQRSRWPLSVRIPVMLGVSVLGYAAVFGLLLLPRLASVLGVGGSWREFTPPGGGFHVSMPGNPSHQPGPANLPGNIQIYTLDLKARHLAFFVSQAEVTGAEWKRMSLSERFHGAREGMLHNTPNARVTAEKHISLEGIP